MYSQQSYHRPRLLLRQRLFPQLEVKERKVLMAKVTAVVAVFFEFADYAITVQDRVGAGAWMPKRDNLRSRLP